MSATELRFAGSASSADGSSASPEEAIVIMEKARVWVAAWSADRAFAMKFPRTDSREGEPANRIT
eukprot:4449532-Prymnesium_polylepis.2